MGKQIKSYGWDFDVDIEKTRSYYERLDGLCDCAMCRNFYSNQQLILKELREFLEQFGIDVAKPIEQWSTIADKGNNIVDNTLYYPVKGYAKSTDGFEIDIGAVQIVVQEPRLDDVVHCPENAINIEVTEPYFIFLVYNLWLPWVVEDNINDSYPESKNIWQRLKILLNKAKFYNKKSNKR